MKSPARHPALWSDKHHYVKRSLHRSLWPDATDRWRFCRGQRRTSPCGGAGFIFIRYATAVSTSSDTRLTACPKSRHGLGVSASITSVILVIMPCCIRLIHRRRARPSIGQFLNADCVGQLDGARDFLICSYRPIDAVAPRLSSGAVSAPSSLLSFMVSLPARRRLSAWRRSPAGRLKQRAPFSIFLATRCRAVDLPVLVGAGLLFGSLFARQLFGFSRLASALFFLAPAASSARRAASFSLLGSTARLGASDGGAVFVVADRWMSAGAAAGPGARRLPVRWLRSASGCRPAHLRLRLDNAPTPRFHLHGLAAAMQLTRPPPIVRFRLSVLPRAFDLAYRFF